MSEIRAGDGVVGWAPVGSTLDFVDVGWVGEDGLTIIPAPRWVTVEIVETDPVEPLAELLVAALGGRVAEGVIDGAGIRFDRPDGCMWIRRDVFRRAES